VLIVHDEIVVEADQDKASVEFWSTCCFQVAASAMLPSADARDKKLNCRLVAPIQL
jgi:hypothetical protein